MNNGEPRSLTGGERIALGIMVAAVIGFAITIQLARSLGFELWMPAAGLAGGGAIMPWVWYQTRSRHPH